MGLANLVLLLPLLSAALAEKATVQWEPCPEVEPYINATLPIDCGRLDVPLDYTQTNSSELYEIQLLRIPAKEQPAKGTIQMNFGGPGDSGLETFIVRAQQHQTLSGGIHDLLTFDPRGVQKNFTFTCADSATAYMSSVQIDGSLSEENSRKVWTLGGAHAKLCEVGNGDEIGDLLGTAFVARDVQKVAEAVDDDGLIRWWGFSYGTTLGATIAALFPDQVDRMIIDGVVNPRLYYNTFADTESHVDMDKFPAYFYETCIQVGPEECPLANLNMTASEMEQDTWDMIGYYSQNPTPINGTDVVLNGLYLKQLFTEAAAYPNQWKSGGLAEKVGVVIWGTDEEREELFAAMEEEGSGGEEAEEGEGDAIFGIKCADRNDRAGSYEELEPTLKEIYNVSKIHGPSEARLVTACMQWPYRAKEIYTGDFNVRTKSPVLVMSSLLDSRTPLASARNVSASLEGSAVLEVDWAGHCAFSAPSVCLGNYMLDYWVNGTLPESGTRCEADVNPWVKYNWTRTFEKMFGSNSTSGNSSSSDLDDLESGDDRGGE